MRVSVDIRQLCAFRGELELRGLTLLIGLGVGEGLAAAALGAVAAAGSVELPEGRATGRSAEEAFALELCLTRYLRGGEPALEVSVAGEGFGCEAALPGGLVRVWGSDRVCGVYASGPADFALRCASVAKGSPALPPATPSALVALSAAPRARLPLEVRAALQKPLFEALAEAGAEELAFDFALVEGRPALVVGGRVAPWSRLPSAALNALGHWLLFSAVAALSGSGRLLLAAVEEPEEGLDPYAAYLLAKVYAVAAGRLGARFVVATRSEAFVKGIEDAVEDGALDAAELKVYEAIGGGFKELRVYEDGTIEGSRFTRVAKRLLERKLLARG